MSDSLREQLKTLLQQVAAMPNATPLAANLQGPCDEFLTRAGLRRRWNCSDSTVKRRENNEGLRATRLGPRMVRYRLSDVIAFEQRQ